MIKTITVYECEDGKRFDSAEDAKKYGMLLYFVFIKMLYLQRQTIKQ